MKCTSSMAQTIGRLLLCTMERVIATCIPYRAMCLGWWTRATPLLCGTDMTLGESRWVLADPWVARWECYSRSGIEGMYMTRKPETTISDQDSIGQSGIGL